MNSQAAVLPDPMRADVAGIHTTKWVAGSVENQGRAIDAVFQAVEGSALPDGLLTLTGYVHPEGNDAFTYGQWSSPEAPQRFVEGLGQEHLGAVEQLVPELERADSTVYTLYRGYVTPDPATAAAVTPDRATAANPPGWIIVVSIAFDEPGRAPGWIDTTLEALRSVEPVDGLITNFFHIDTTGTRVINYTEWSDREKHKAAHAGDTGPIGQNGAVGKRIKSLPGVVGIELSRYQLHRSFAA